MFRALGHFLALINQLCILIPACKAMKSERACSLVLQVKNLQLQKFKSYYYVCSAGAQICPIQAV